MNEEYIRKVTRTITEDTYAQTTACCDAIVRSNIIKAISRPIFEHIYIETAIRVNSVTKLGINSGD